MVNFRFVSAIGISSLIFLLGIFLGQAISYYNLSEVRQTQEKLLYKMTGYDLTYSILSEKNVCNLSFRDFIKERVELGQKLVSLEERFGPENEEAKSLQERYHLYQIREYLFFKEFNQECSRQIPLILYFYSDNCDMCDAQGNILDALYARNKSMNIYAIDYGVDNIALRTVKNLYEINTTPSVVINGKTYNHFLSFKELNNILYGEAS